MLHISLDHKQLLLNIKQLSTGHAVNTGGPIITEALLYDLLVCRNKIMIITTELHPTNYSAAIIY